MRTQHYSFAEQLSVVTLAAGLLSLGGCGDSGSGTGSTGGASSATGGQTSSATGGSTASGGQGQGGAAQGGAAQGGAPQGGAASGGAASGGSARGGAGGTAQGGANGGSAGSVSQGGATASGGAGTSGAPSTGGSANGGASNGGGSNGGASSGGSANGGAASGGAAAGGFTGTCTASKATGTNVSGSGPHKVTVETNSESGIREGTIYRPTDLGGSEKYPIFVWGNGACSQNGLSNTAAMGEIASHGYFVISDGTPNGGGNRAQTSDWVSMGKPLVAYITWAIAENEKPCSAYYHALDVSKVASNGFSCGGLMSEGAAIDPRITAWGFTSSGLTSVDNNHYKKIHAPTLIILGGTSDVAYNNGQNDFKGISALGIPTLLFSKNIGHGGDLGSARGGDFTKLNLAWLNWQLKGDTGATGKGVLVGSSCSYCSDNAWEVKSKNID